jgi:hypothetical protein
VEQTAYQALLDRKTDQPQWLSPFFLSALEECVKSKSGFSAYHGRKTPNRSYTARA